MRPYIVSTQTDPSDPKTLTVIIGHTDRSVAEEYAANYFGCTGPKQDYRNKNKLTWLCSVTELDTHTFMIEVA